MDWAWKALEIVIALLAGACLTIVGIYRGQQTKNTEDIEQLKADVLLKKEHCPDHVKHGDCLYAIKGQYNHIDKQLAGIRQILTTAAKTGIFHRHESVDGKPIMLNDLFEREE